MDETDITNVGGRSLEGVSGDEFKTFLVTHQENNERDMNSNWKVLRRRNVKSIINMGLFEFICTELWVN